MLAGWLTVCIICIVCVCEWGRKKPSTELRTHIHVIAAAKTNKNMPNQNQYQKNDDDERETQKKMNFIDGMNVGVDDSVTLCFFCLCLCLSLSRSYTLSFSSFFTSKCNVFNQKNHFNKFTFIITINIIRLSVSARERAHIHTVNTNRNGIRFHPHRNSHVWKINHPVCEINRLILMKCRECVSVCVFARLRECRAWHLSLAPRCYRCWCWCYCRCRNAFSL